MKPIRRLLIDTGMRQSIELFLKEVSFCAMRASCCSYGEVTIYIPHFLLTPSASAGILERYYGKKIIIELQFERMLTQILITVGTFTDFTNPVHTTDRFKVNSYHERRHLRTENYTVSLTVAYKFILALIPHLHSRTLNVITVSPDAASNLIHSFETPGDPSGSYRRVLLANI